MNPNLIKETYGDQFSGVRNMLIHNPSLMNQCLDKAEQYVNVPKCVICSKKTLDLISNCFLDPNNFIRHIDYCKKCWYSSGKKEPQAVCCLCKKPATDVAEWFHPKEEKVTMTYFPACGDECRINLEVHNIETIRKFVHMRANKCVVCGKFDRKLLQCPCLKVYYCSKECQRSNWKTHKSSCQIKKDEQ